MTAHPAHDRSRARAGILARCLPLGVVLVLSACAAYHPLPLPPSPHLAGSVAELRHAGVDPAEPLGMASVALLALQNDPDLLAARARHGVAQAQLLQAGLAPNPVVTGSILPLAAGIGDTTAWNAGLNYDIRALITLRARRRGARAAAAQVDAELLWQEWQVVGQARLLAVDLIEGERSLRLLGTTRALLAARSARSHGALAAGNATLSAVAPDSAALQAARAQVDDLTRVQLQRRHQLAALLGLLPDAPLPLADAPDLPPLDAQAVLAALPSLPDRRPDLVALQLGYAAQDATLRAAILAQFPNLAFGITGGSDNANVRNVGPQISLDLPVFDHNQGGVAIARATRTQLHDEYAARLAAADGQVRAMLAEIVLLERQLDGVRRDLPAAEAAANVATAALGQGNLDERSYVDLVSTRYAKEQDIVVIEQSLLEQRVAIATLIGAGMPDVALPTPPPGAGT